MRALSPMAATVALALMAAPDDQGGGQTTDPAAEAKAAEETASTQTDEGVAAEAAPAQAAEEAAAEAVPAKKGGAKASASKADVLLIWVQPGHERYFIGQPVEFPAADAEFLRSAGRAREATPAEVKAWKDARKAAE